MNEKKLELIKAIMDLPEGKQRAMLWLIKHYQFAVEMCKEGALTQEQSMAFEKDAITRCDDYLLVLVLFERIVNAEKDIIEKS